MTHINISNKRQQLAENVPIPTTTVVMSMSSSSLQQQQQPQHNQYRRRRQTLKFTGNGNGRSTTILMMMLVFYILALSNLIVVSGYSVKSYPYIYPTQDEPKNSSWPVQDYIVPANIMNNKKLLNNNMPDFLYNPPSNVYRIVEFYAHWCGRCRAFKSHYIAITRRIVEVAIQHGKHIEIHSVSCTPNKPLCNKQHIKGYPKVYMYPAGSTVGELIPFQSFSPYYIFTKLLKLDISEDELDSWDLDGAIIAAEQDIIQSDNSNPYHINVQHNDVTNNVWNMYGLFGDNHEHPHTLTKEQERQLTIKNHKRTHNELKDDIYLSLDFIFRNGIYVDNGDNGNMPLQQDKRAALHSFLNLLQLTISPSWTHLHKLINELLLDYIFVTKNEQYLISVLDDHMLSGNRTQWSISCSKGIIDNGFTCGIWELFHTISIGLVEYNTVTLSPLSTEMVGRTIKDFIYHFFTCDVCRDNFILMYNNCDFNRCTRLTHETGKEQRLHHKKFKNDKEQELANQYNVSAGYEVALWLFEVHNAVNVRLYYESNDELVRRKKGVATITNDMLYKNVLWPSQYTECYRCWNIMNNTDIDIFDDTTKSNNIVQSFITSRTGVNQLFLYNRNSIIQYLQLEYGGESTIKLNTFNKIVHDEARVLIEQHEEQVYILKHKQDTKKYTIQFIITCIGILVLVLSYHLLYTNQQQKIIQGSHKKYDD